MNLKYMPLALETVCLVVWLILGGLTELSVGNIYALGATIALGIAVITSTVWAKTRQ